MQMTARTARSLLFRKVGRTLSLGAFVLALAACGGGGGGGDGVDVGSGIPGTYEHEVEGQIVLAVDGTGTVDHGEVPITWEANGDTVTLDADGRTAEATITEDSLVFEPGVYSCCDDTEAVFVRIDDAG